MTGGVDMRIAGVAVRSRDPFRALVASLLLFTAAAVVYPDECTKLLERSAARVQRYAVAVALAGGLLLAIHGVVFGSFGVGGADSYGYVNQAYEWASGSLPRPIPLTMSLPFDTSDPMQAPLGYRVGTTPHTIVPTYAPGLPLIMAVALVAGSCGPYFVVPAFSLLFVWFTFRLGMLAAGRAGAIVAVLVLVTTPVVLYQALWPMSDIPAGALWTAAFVYALRGSRKDAVISGLWTAVGLLVRPNLLLVPIVPVVLLALHSRGWERWTRAAIFCVPIVPVAVFIAFLNTAWYGAPSNSGYGAAREIYLVANVWPNVKLYSAWLLESHSWWMLLALVPFVPPFSRHVDRRTLAACAFIALVTLASYLSYSPFEVWWYLRFLMPAFGAFAVMVAAGLIAIGRTVPMPFGGFVATLAVGLMMMTTVSFASSKGVFGDLRAGERRYIDIGEFCADHLPANAALFAVQHSGSLRFYSGRLTLRFDWVQKEWAGRVPGAVERAGYRPYLVVDDWEIPQVRKQFGLGDNAPLPWPIVARMRDLGGLTVFDMSTAPVATTPIALEPGSRQWCAPRSRPPT